MSSIINSNSFFNCKNLKKIYVGKDTVINNLNLSKTQIKDFKPVEQYQKDTEDILYAPKEVIKHTKFPPKDASIDVDFTSEEITNLNERLEQQGIVVGNLTNELQQAQKNLASDISLKTSQLTSLQTQNSQLQTTLSSIQNQLNSSNVDKESLQRQVENLNRQVNEIKNKDSEINSLKQQIANLEYQIKEPSWIDTITYGSKRKGAWLKSYNEIGGKDIGIAFLDYSGHKIKIYFESEVFRYAEIETRYSLGGENNMFRDGKVDFKWVNGSTESKLQDLLKAAVKAK